MNAWFPLAFFISLGPVYWFHTLGYFELAVIKYALIIVFMLVFIFDFIKSKRRFLFPDNFGPFLFVLILCFLIFSAFKSEDTGAVYAKLINYFLAFGLVWLTYNASFLYSDFEETCSKFLILIPIISVLILTSYFFDFPSWRGPYYDASFLIAKLDYTGFGSTRTAWSNGLPLIYPLILIGGYDYFSKNKKFLFFVILMFFMSVFLPGGRGGVLAVLLISFIALRLYFPKNVISLISIILIFILSLLLISELGGETRALRKLGDAENLDHFSSGRLAGIKIGLEIINENPLVGKGLGNVDLRQYGFDGRSIHNYWIGISAEHGLFMPVLLMLMFFWVFWDYFKKRKLIAIKYKSSFYVVIAGLFMSNLEPSGFIGAFQQHSVFWICLGRLLFILKYKTKSLSFS